HFGFPALGLKGAAIATAISRGMTMLLSFYILIKRDKLITFDIPSWKVLSGCWSSILYIAVPSGLARLVVPLATGVITALLATYGEYAVAAYGVGSRVEFLANSLLFALAASIGPFVGQNLGKGRLDRVKNAVKISNVFAVCWGLVTWVVLAFGSRHIAGIFNADEQVIRTIQLFLWIVPAGFGLQGVLSIVNSQLNTLNKPLQASAVIIVQMLVLGLPAIYLGKELLGISGIFAGIAIAYVLGGLMSIALNGWLMKRMT
ncbi:MAG: MATE family efflux transporter, partial [Bacteroidota bacterium]